MKILLFKNKLSIITMLSNTILEQIKVLLKKSFENKSYEFEIMFNNYRSNNKLSFVKFIDLLYFIKYRSEQNKNYKLIEENTLDISYNYSDNDVYRITINTVDKINNILNTIHQRKNHIIFSILCSSFINDEDVSFINKTKDYKDILDIDNYNLRIRLSNEYKLDKKTLNTISSNIQYTDSDKIFFRYKNRISLIIFSNEDLGTLRLDLTFIKSSNSVNKLEEAQKQFEAELEYTPGKNKDYDKILNLIHDEIYIIKQVLEGSSEILTKKEHDDIIKEYKKLLFNSESENITNLYSMSVTSTEIQHIVEKIPHAYSVSDKIDGDKYQIFIFNNIIYLISNNLAVKKTKYSIEGINNTLLEGELIQLNNNNIYLFMIYDCLFYNGQNIRNEILLKTRLSYINKFLDKMNIKSYSVQPYINSFDIIKQEEHYNNELIKYYSTLNNLIEKCKSNDILFYNKVFLFPTGGHSCEVYSFSDLILSGCSSGKFKCPYNLDGIIYTGIEQKYTRDKREQKYIIYKYKPPNDNSIDVYLVFQKNIETNKLLEIYDNSINGYLPNSIFRVANFYVGDSISNREIPSLFMKEQNNHEAFLLIENGEVRDLHGKIVNNNTVVEIIYINDPSIPHQYRWKILRTRWDKTESVIRDNKNYGNYKDIATRIWKSITESVTIDEIKKLARPETYYIQQKLLIQKIDTKIITTDKEQDKYYQKITNLGKIFREFTNWVKSIILYTYGSPENNKKKSLLDLGCGRGGDILKMYHARLGEYVGTDIDPDGLFGAIDSAKARYLNFIKKFPDFIKSVTFILANNRLPLDSKSQESAILNMTVENKKLIDKIFTSTKQFDIINCNLAIHYLFDSHESINNLTNTIKQFLIKDGYFLCITIDPDQLMKLFNNKNIYTSMYTDEDGSRQKYFEIIKKFDGPYQDIPGQAVDYYMAWISNEGTYITEYVVPPNYLINIMKKADCEFVDSDLFVNVYNINKEWFLKVINHEENEKNKKFYKSVAKFYDDLKGSDKESLIWNELWRYYIFKKRT